MTHGDGRGGLSDFLDSVDRILTLEHLGDDVQREVTAALFDDRVQFRQLKLLMTVTQSLERAADALAGCALLLRDHFLRDG